MRPSKAHGFVAWLFDLYIVSFLIGGLTALTLSISDTTGDMRMALGVFGAAFFLTIAYHLALSRRTIWRSPGEQVAGRFVDGETKLWLNPYSRTRWPLFAVMLLVTILAGNTWDGIGRGSEMTLTKVALDVAALIILTIGLVAVGQGRAWWMLAIALYPVLLAITALRSSEELSLPAAALTGLVVFFAVIASLAVVTAGIYSRHRGQATAV